MTYIFRYRNSLYVLQEGTEKRAWETLQQRLSWNMRVVKERVKLLETIKEVDNRIVKINL